MLFPEDSPSTATGPGALVWAAGPSCPGGAGARIQPILPGEPPGTPAAPRGAPAPLAPLNAASSPGGRIALAGADPSANGSSLVVQGRAGSGFAVLRAGGPASPLPALSTAYLGDLALAAATGARGPASIALSIERWYGGALHPPRQAGGPARGGVTALTVALDFRSDALAAWSQGGSVWVRDLPASGAAPKARRLGPAGARTEIAALLSDDNRGIVMWSEQSAGTTSLWIDYSAPGPRFGAPTLVERDVDPGGTAASGSSPLLARLSSEGVVAAWSGVSAGRWVVHAAPIDQHGLRSVSTLAAETTGSPQLSRRNRRRAGAARARPRPARRGRAAARRTSGRSLRRSGAALVPRLRGSWQRAADAS